MKKLAFLTSLLFAVLAGSAQPSTHQSTSSGFFISSQGYIVTNYHAVERATAISVTCTLPGQTLTWKAQVVVEDPKTDLAILKITDPTYVPLPPVPYSFRKGTADVGESIFVLGYPLTTSMGKEVKLTDGIISAKTGVLGDVTLYQVSASVQPGNSGGPLFDKNGNIVGVVRARHKQAENATYAVKIAYLLGMLDLLPDPVLLPATNQLNGKSLPEQVKLASKYVCLLEVTHEDESASDEDEQVTRAMAWLDKAQRSIDEDNFQTALAQIEESLRILPQNPRAYLMRGWVHLYMLKESEAALNDFSEVIEIDPESSVAYFYRGHALWFLDRPAEALLDFNRTLALDAEDVDGYFMRGLILSGKGNYLEAIGNYNEVLKREKTAEPFAFQMEHVYHQKAYCLLQLDKATEALPLLTKALQMNAEIGSIWYTRGQAYFKLEQFGNSIKDMTKVLEFDELAAAYFYRGLSYLQLDKMPEGCTDLRRSAELGDEDAADIVAEFCEGVNPVPRPSNSGSTQTSRPTPPPVPVYPETLFAAPFKTTTKRAGVLWGQPSHEGKYLQNIAAQTNVEAIGYSNGFWKVRINGAIGFLDEQTIYITFGMRDAIAK